MRKLMLICFLISVLLLSQFKVYADFIFEPNDDFYKKNFSKCTYVNRVFIANGKDGYIVIYKDPVSKALDSALNGKEFMVYSEYVSSGKIWGVVDYYDTTAWLLLDEMVAKYDNESFLEEHKKEIKIINEEFKNTLPNKEIVFYNYPGSNEKFLNTVADDDIVYFTKTYTDRENRVWGMCNYYYGARNHWICITDPTNANLPVTEIKYNLIEAKSAPSVIVESPETIVANNDSTEALIIISVIFVVILTAILMLIFWRKKGKK